MAGQIIGQINAGDGSKNLISSNFYATCGTAASTVNKVIAVQLSDINSITLRTGMTLAVKFTNSNTATNPKFVFYNSAGSSTLAGTKNGTAFTAGTTFTVKLNDTSNVGKTVETS